MASRLSLHSQLSSIMETMAKSVLTQVCTLVDEDSAELRSEISRLLFANSALAEKVNSLECKLTIVRSDSSKMSKNHRSIGVQTVNCSDEEDAPNVSTPPTIDEIFGKDWCMTLWKDRDSLQKSTGSPQSPEKSVETFSDQVTVTDVKEETYIQDAAIFSPQKALNTKVDEESMAEESEQLSVDYSMDGSSTCLSFDQVGKQRVSTGGIKEATVQMLSINDTDEIFSSHIIPIEVEEEEEEEEEEDYDYDYDDDDDDDDEDDDEVQFVQASQQESAKNSAAGPSRDKQQLLVIDNPENPAALDKNSHNDISSVQRNRANIGTFTCQICDRSFFHKGTLTKHMKSHKLNFCSICKQHFSHRNKLNSHSCVPPVPPQRITKSCELCGKTFANPSALRIHYVVHTGEKPYRCSLCGKRFTQKGNLKCHLRIHTGERPFRCVKCGKNFTQKVNLNHHLMAHLNRDVGERPDGQKQAKNVTAESCQ